jgi:membrane-bound serine protease (ClpP class)
MKKIRLVISFIALAMAFMMLIPFVTQANTGQKVVVAEVHEEVERGLYAFIGRAINEAEEMNADALILDIKSPGGLVNAALDIGELLESTNLKIIAHVNGYALSAAAFISLHADEIYMTQNATMGAAQVIDSSGNAAGDKAESAWTSAMIAIAKSKDRDPKFAEAMANPDVDLPKYRAGVGDLLTLTADEAVEVGYAKGIANSLQEVLDLTNLADAEVTSLQPTFFENVVRFITNPIIIPILLSIASIGLVMELYSPGFGVPGTMGLSAIGLFFFGHLLAGLAGFEVIIMFVIGLILLIAELFVPGGILGVVGGALMVMSVIFAGESVTHMVLSIIIAMIIAVVGMVILMKFFGKKLHVFNKLVLRDATTSEEGYVSNENRIELIGKVGQTLTALRPAGVVQVDDERLDVVSEGTFIDAHKQVTIVKVEGSRIVVREI